jgi:hypothetical protein
MPIVGVLFAALLLGGGGFVVGVGAGALVVELLHRRLVRLREQQGADVCREDELSAGCGPLLTGALLGGVLGCCAALGVGAAFVALATEG